MSVSAGSYAPPHARPEPTADERAITEPPAALAERPGSTGVDRLRLLGRDDGNDAVHAAAHRAGIAVDDAPAVGAPEIELPRWLREQSVTITNHRHGRITPLIPPANA